MGLTVVVIGDGAMGTVCGQILSGRVEEVRIWGRDSGRVGEMNRARENARYLPGVKLAENVRFVGADAEVVEGGGVELIVGAVPTQFIRGVFGRLGPHVPAGVPVVSVAKGIEIATLKRPSEVIRDVLDGGGGGRAVGALSGPSIAGELGRKLPATMVVGAEEQRGGGGEAFAKRVQELFTTSYLRVYWNADLLGVELAGALKNVVAIAAGILDGMKAGNNAKAALLTRGLVEITRLGVALGAQAETFAGLAGMGDLFTTCVSPEGRNRSFGERVGRGEKVEVVLGSVVGVVEGVPTCESVVRIARERGIDMPICEGLHAVLFEGREPRGQLADLMSREPKREG